MKKQKAEDLLNEFGNISDEYIKDAEIIEKAPPKRIKISKIAAVAAIAACICLIAIVAVNIGVTPGLPIVPDNINLSSGADNSNKNLIKLEFSKINANQYPVEDLTAYKDMEEFEKSSPINADLWGDEAPSYLPVYSDYGNYDRYEKFEARSEEEKEESREQQEAVAQKLAVRIGETILSTYFEEVTVESFAMWEGDPPKDYVDKYHIDELTARTNGADIRVSSSYLGNYTNIELYESIEIPKEYKQLVQTDGSMNKTATDYLLNEFKGYIGFTNPQMKYDEIRSICPQLGGNILSGWYVYEKGDNLSESIISYYFDNTFFSANAEGNLERIFEGNTRDKMENLGDYPIISPEEAKETLLNGKYMDTQWEIGYLEIDEENIVRTDLVYNEGQGTQSSYYIPSYRFVIDRSEGTQIAFIPAVDPNYLTGFPIYEESASKEKASDKPAESEESTESKILENLPKISIEKETVPSEWELYEVTDISDLEDGNPWNEDMIFDTMPVYKNLSYLDGSGMAAFAGGKADMEEKAREVADHLSEQIYSMSYKTLQDEGNNLEVYHERFEDLTEVITQFTAETKNYTITVYPTLSVRINPKNGESLPEGIKTFGEAKTRENLIEGTNMIIEAYEDFIGYEEPAYKLYNSRYMSMADSIFAWNIYDRTGDTKEQMLNYFFKFIEFQPNLDGKMERIDIVDYEPRLEKIGDYPVMTPDEAKQELLNGNYISEQTKQFLSDKPEIKKVELCYQVRGDMSMVMPYYKLYLESSVKSDDGKMNLYCYKIPAVRSDYIE